MERAVLSQIFHQLLPADCIIDDQLSLRAYECDGLSAYREVPLLVVMPSNVEQVQSVLKLCRDHDIPVVTRGAGTSLSGGALPHRRGIVLSLAKMNKILSVDTRNQVAVVQPGVRNAAISEAVAAYGLYYAPDPSSQIACSIGGNVAENAGGVHCLKYGLTIHNIIKVTVVTIDGDIVQLGHAGLQQAGYDLLSLMIGSEGLLGVVVEVTVKLLPTPVQAKLLMGVFEQVTQAGDAVAEVIAQGVIPAGIEMMDNLAIRAAEDFVKAGYPVDAAAILLCELDGIEAEVDEQIAQVDAIFRRLGAQAVIQAQDEMERQRFWSGRKAAFPAVGRISPDYYCIDGTIPRKHLGSILERISELSEHYQLPVANVFHAGDGNLHPLILYDASIPGQFENTEELGSKILLACLDAGGTITGEHGVGVEKINEMCVQFSDAELAQFRRLKDVFDPYTLLNPGKAIPTLARCAEHNAMHVHNGELPFPELERF